MCVGTINRHRSKSHGIAAARKSVFIAGARLIRNSDGGIAAGQQGQRASGVSAARCSMQQGSEGGGTFETSNHRTAGGGNRRTACCRGPLTGSHDS